MFVFFMFSFFFRGHLGTPESPTTKMKFGPLGEIEMGNLEGESALADICHCPEGQGLVDRDL